MLNNMENKIEIHMPEHDTKILKNYLKNAEIFIEYGCGGSTLYACNLDNIKKIISTESDKNWVELLKNNQNIKNALYFS